MDNTVESAPVAAADAAPVAETSTYEKFLAELKVSVNKFFDEAAAGFKNKAAALRARKASLELRKNLQEFREVSIQNDKAAK